MGSGASDLSERGPGKRGVEAVALRPLDRHQPMASTERGIGIVGGVDHARGAFVGPDMVVPAGEHQQRSGCAKRHHIIELEVAKETRDDILARAVAASRDGLGDKANRAGNQSGGDIVLQCGDEERHHAPED